MRKHLGDQRAGKHQDIDQQEQPGEQRRQPLGKLGRREQEAGGRVSDWEGGPDYLSGDILAGSPAVQTTSS